MKLLFNENGFTWDMGNRYLGSAIRTQNGWDIKSGHIWETGQPRFMGHKKGPFLNLNTGEYTGKWVEITDQEFDPKQVMGQENINSWLTPGKWCDKLHQIGLAKLNS